jgi:hypothetical protein
MSVAGIDFGNLSLLIGQTSKGGVDVILNESSNRQTATSVSIQGKQRFIGDSGAAMVRILNSLLFIDQNEAYRYRYNFIFTGQV